MTVLLSGIRAVGDAPETTVIQITDRVLVKDVERPGVHFGGDNYYDSVVLKKRVAENFEGTINRIHVTGPAPQPDPTGLYLYGENDARELEGFVGGRAFVDSGPDLFQERKFVSLERRDRPDGKPGKTHFIKLDRPVKWSEEWMNGLLLDASAPDSGQMPWHEPRRKEVDGKRVWTREYDDRNVTPNTAFIVTGDTPPDGGGKRALLLDATKGESWVRFRVQFWQSAPYAGTWTARDSRTNFVSSRSRAKRPRGIRTCA